MMRNLLPVGNGRLGGANIQAMINAHRIAGNDLAAKVLGQLHGQTAFPHGSRSDNHKQTVQLCSSLSKIP